MNIFEFFDLIKKWFLRNFLVLFLVFSLAHALFATRINVIWSDAEAYYMYLPALTIYGNFSDIPINTPEQFERYSGSGNYVAKVTFGVGLMQLPFYAIAHLYCSFSENYQAGGYSLPYEIAIQMATAFYAFIGLFYLRKTLREYFDDQIANLVPIIIIFSTNFYHYTIFEPGMSHIYCFCLFSSTFYYFRKFLNDPSWSSAFQYSVLLALLLFIRPTNFFYLLFLILTDTNSWSSIKLRCLFILQYWVKMSLPILPLLALITLQILLWSEMFGTFTYDSYNNEGFINWDNPYVLSVLFSFKNGLFLYAPILLFSIAGIVIGLVKKAVNSWSILIVFLTFTYMVASWWSWSYAQAFGHRAYVEWLFLLAIPMAYYLQFIKHKTRAFISYLHIPVFILGIYYTMGFNYYYMSRMIGDFWNLNNYIEGLKYMF